VHYTFEALHSWFENVRARCISEWKTDLAFLYANGNLTSSGARR
jgi:hypothetical protein